MPGPNSTNDATCEPVAENLAAVSKRIRLAENKAGRNPYEVKLLAVSKTKPAAAIHQAWQAGQHAFGENYLQEALEKIAALSELDIEWHFIGAIQSNKTRAIAENFDWVQSISSEKIARRLARQRPEGYPPLNCCIQVNIDDEASKAGIKPDESLALASIIDSLPGLNLRGLMCIPRAGASPQQQAASSSAMQKLFGQTQQQFGTVDTLSMGMSADMETAISHGSNLVRVGTAIFGTRTKT